MTVHILSQSDPLASTHLIYFKMTDLRYNEVLELGLNIATLPLIAVSDNMMKHVSVHFLNTQFMIYYSKGIGTIIAPF